MYFGRILRNFDFVMQPYWLTVFPFSLSVIPCYKPAPTLGAILFVGEQVSAAMAVAGLVATVLIVTVFPFSLSVSPSTLALPIHLEQCSLWGAAGYGLPLLALSQYLQTILPTFLLPKVGIMDSWYSFERVR